MAKISKWHPLHNSLVMHHQGIRRALNEGIIWIPEPLEDAQFQPNELDVRIGRVDVWDPAELHQRFYRQSISLPGDGLFRKKEPSIPPSASYPNQKDIPIIIPPRARVELTLHEHIYYDPAIMTLEAGFRSGRGRLGFKLDYHLVIDQGEIKFVFTNRNPNSVILYGHDRIMQIFLHPTSGADGIVVGDENRLEQIARELGGVETFGSYLIFRASEEIFSYKKREEPVDTRKEYTTEDLFESHKLPFKVSLQDPYLIPLRPKVTVPANLGIQLLPQIPITEKPFQVEPDEERFNLDTQMVAAGWIDSGYAGGITAQAWFLKKEVTIKPEWVIGFGVAYEYASPVKKLYGTVSNTPRAQLFGSKE